VPGATNTENRLISILGGLRLFIEHPIFGAGLGAFRNQMIFRSQVPVPVDPFNRGLAPGRIRAIGFLVCAVPAIYAFCKE
jgi:hypothetical protein